MATTTFLIADYMKALKANGCSSELTQVHGEYIEKLYHDHLFTKEDGESLKNDLKQEMKILKKDLTIWLGGIVISSYVLAVGFLTLIHFFGK